MLGRMDGWMDGRVHKENTPLLFTKNYVHDQNIIVHHAKLTQQQPPSQGIYADEYDQSPNEEPHIKTASAPI